MKKAFSEYYELDKQEYSDLWNNCLFIFDTNILLNLYRYSQKTRSTLLNILDVIKDRLWLPYQIGYEYQKNRVNVITEMECVFDKALKQVDSQLNQIKTELKNIKYPSWEDKENSKLIKIINNSKTQINKVIEDDKKNHPDLKKNDYIRERLSKLYDSKIGEKYTNEDLRKIYCEGKSRYENKLPPGYEDCKKTTNYEKYGDLIIWKQIIDKSKEVNKPIIFITDDTKEDWWWIVKSETVGCRPELTKEFKAETGQRFYMYNSERFIKFAKDNLDIHVNADVINEVKEVRENIIIDNYDINKFNKIYDILIEDQKNKYGLTNREMDVLKLVFQGYTNSEIAQELMISLHTAKCIVGNILHKTGVNDRVALAVKAYKERLIENIDNED